MIFGYGEIIRFRYDHELSWGWDFHDGINALIKKGKDTRALSAKRGHSEEDDHLQARRRPSPEHDHTDPLISPFQPPDVREMYLCWLSHSSWCFVGAG